MVPPRLSAAAPAFSGNLVPFTAVRWRSAGVARSCAPSNITGSGCAPAVADSWITSQVALPRTSHIDWITARALLGDVSTSDTYESFWRQALSGSDQLRHDLSTKDPLYARVRDGQHNAALGVVAQGEHGAKLIEFHSSLSTVFAVATSSNFLTLPDGVIGKASTKCHATGVFWRASPVA